VPTSRGIAVYSFSLNPESKQVNGTANFSRIDQPILSLNLRQINSGNTGTLYCFARNVNLFRVAGGMGGVAFASWLIKIKNQKFMLFIAYFYVCWKTNSRAKK
jgi:hypothetical protein